MPSVYGGQAESVASIGRSEAEDAAPLDSGVPGMPPSWVPKLQIGRDSLDMRCPRGIKTVLYHRCQHEIFALFGECSRWDGMVDKLTLYEVRACLHQPSHHPSCCRVSLLLSSASLQWAVLQLCRAMRCCCTVRCQMPSYASLCCATFGMTVPCLAEL